MHLSAAKRAILQYLNLVFHGMILRETLNFLITNNIGQLALTTRSNAMYYVEAICC